MYFVKNYVFYFSFAIDFRLGNPYLIKHFHKTPSSLKKQNIACIIYLTPFSLGISTKMNRESEYLSFYTKTN